MRRMYKWLLNAYNSFGSKQEEKIQERQAEKYEHIRKALYFQGSNEIVAYTSTLVLSIPLLDYKLLPFEAYTRV